MQKLPKMRPMRPIPTYYRAERRMRVPHHLPPLPHCPITGGLVYAVVRGCVGLQAN